MISGIAQSENPGEEAEDQSQDEACAGDDAPEEGIAGRTLLQDNEQTITYQINQ